MIFQIIVILLLFPKPNFGENLAEDWIDPFDMTPSKDYLEFETNPSPLHANLNQDTKSRKNCICDTKNSLSEMYFRRMVNMLLNSVHEDFIVNDMYTGHLFLKIDAEKYVLLKHFADSSDSAKDYDKIDKILSDVFTKPTEEYLIEYFEGWFCKIFNLMLSRSGIIVIIIATYVAVILLLFRKKYSFFKLFQFIILNIFLFDFVFTWIHLYQKAQAEDFSNKVKYKDMPVECDISKMNSMHFLVNIFSSEDRCTKFYELKYQDIFYKVTPGTVLTEMFARSIQYPAKSIGMAFGDLTRGIYNAIPWPMNIIIFPICLIFVCVIFAILMSIIFSKPIKFNFFHVISFSFGDDKQKIIYKKDQDMISGQNLTTLLNITQNKRPFIEDIPISNQETEVTEEKLRLKEIENGHENKIDDEETIDKK